MLKTESKKLPEASIFSILLHPQSDSTQSLIQVENQASLLWTHPKIDNVVAGTLRESRTLIVHSACASSNQTLAPP